MQHRKPPPSLNSVGFYILLLCFGFTRRCRWWISRFSVIVNEFYAQQRPSRHRNRQEKREIESNYFNECRTCTKLSQLLWFSRSQGVIFVIETLCQVHIGIKTVLFDFEGNYEIPAVCLVSLVWIQYLSFLWIPQIVWMNAELFLARFLAEDLTKDVGICNAISSFLLPTRKVLSPSSSARSSLHLGRLHWRTFFNLWFDVWFISTFAICVIANESEKLIDAINAILIWFSSLQILLRITYWLVYELCEEKIEERRRRIDSWGCWCKRRKRNLELVSLSINLYIYWISGNIWNVDWNSHALIFSWSFLRSWWW